MTGEKSNQLLGEYLTSVGLLNLDELREAANIARTQNLPIGKVLVMSGYLSKELLQATIELQARVKDEQLDYKIALQVLNLVSKENMSLDEALSLLSQADADSEGGNRLGEFLIGACLVSDKDLTNALEQSAHCGLPLGRMLVNLDIISEPMLNDVLTMQSLVRNGKTTKAEAIKKLLANKEQHFEVQQAVPNNEPALPQQPIDNDNSAIAPTPRKRPGATGNRITGQFSALPELSLHQMLRAAGLMETAVLEKAIQDSLEDAQIMTAILKKSQLLEDFIIEATEQCCQLIAKRQLKPEQAIIALQHCHRTRNSLHDCLIEFGWAPSRETVNS